MSNVVDYKGRQADYWAYQPVLVPGRDMLLVPELVSPSNGGSIIAGIEKLVQKILITLLTPRGSKLHDPEDGTDFMIDAQRGLWRTTADVEQSFYAARVDMRRLIVLDEVDTDPADERYGEVTLTDIVLAGDRVTLGVTVTSAAGLSRQILAPIQVPLQ